MKCSQYLNKDLVLLQIPSGLKKDAIEYLTSVLCEYYKIPYKREILCNVLERERIKSTGIGKGIAIPHGRIDFVDKLFMVFARCEKGIEWDAADNKPVHYIFYIIGPSKIEKEYLELLSDISRIRMRRALIGKICVANDVCEIISLIQKAEVRKEKREK